MICVHPLMMTCVHPFEHLTINGMSLSPVMQDKDRILMYRVTITAYCNACEEHVSNSYNQVNKNVSP